MKSKSPARIVELCVYILIIIAAMIWMLAGGRLYNPPDIPSPTQTVQPTNHSAPPPVVVPRGDVFPGQ